MIDLSDKVSRYQFGSTQWGPVLAAGETEGDSAAAARNWLLVHYHDAVYRYLCAKLGDTHAAGELFSQFAVRVLEIHPFLKRADPKKGRFRDYLRAVLSRMIIDWYRKASKEPAALPVDAEPAVEVDDDLGEAEFRAVWAEELCNHAWRRLEEIEKSEGKPFYSLLLYKAQNPKTRAEELAQYFTQKLGRPIAAENARKIVQRANEMLNDLLVEEVALSLKRDGQDRVDADRIEEEMIDLQLLDKPRRAALERFRKNAG